jgi:hypothetical protein
VRGTQARLSSSTSATRIPEIGGLVTTAPHHPTPEPATCDGRRPEDHDPCRARTPRLTPAGCIRGRDEVRRLHVPRTASSAVTPGRRHSPRLMPHADPGSQARSQSVIGTIAATRASPPIWSTTQLSAWSPGSRRNRHYGTFLSRHVVLATEICPTTRTRRSSSEMGTLRRRCGEDGPPDWPGVSCCEHRGDDWSYRCERVPSAHSYAEISVFIRD